MTFDDNVNKHLKDWDPEYLPSISKIFKKPLAQKLWIEEVFKSIYDYSPEYGLSMDQQAEEQIFGSMIFGHFEKKPMHQLQKILGKVLSEHYIEVLNVVIDYHNNYSKGTREHNYWDWLMIRWPWVWEILG